jgi:Protein of unknown function (DUF4058)
MKLTANSACGALNMAGPFPGMDPYIECHGNWLDFHKRLIAEIANTLGTQLPDDYVARFDERIVVVSFDGANGASYRPDVLVAHRETPAKTSRGTSSAAAVTLEPRLIDVSDHDPEEIHQTWLEIRRLPKMELVTVVEVLSPAKPGSRRFGRHGELAGANPPEAPRASRGRGCGRARSRRRRRSGRCR